MANNKLFIQAHNDKHRVRNGQFQTIEAGRVYVDGFNITEFSVQAVCGSRKEVEDLIRVLEVAKHAFYETRCGNCGEPI